MRPAIACVEEREDEYYKVTRQEEVGGEGGIRGEGYPAAKACMRGLSAKGSNGFPQVLPIGFQPDWKTVGLSERPPDEMRDGAATTLSCNT
jgi:hypothetical protein